MSPNDHFHQPFRRGATAAGQGADAHGPKHSLRNCEYSLGELKALRGRLAMRWASGSSEAHQRVSGELIALSLARAQCMDPAEDENCWLPLRSGFLVPLDDIRDLLPPGSKT